ncbi:PREDICTED: N-alpha-acetyltransferase 30-like [Branchiostoma belcheri]|uniref:N-alpha-acetyltransferase 30 n=1 Tax=Branchiostoma belcheri TaxID=7741 RepID=A0A6P4ZMN2_BRABE|nr:PREDICTED: N-alpha-acetyltransferase 30-like [Branchiostoma belcheri]
MMSDSSVIGKEQAVPCNMEVVGEGSMVEKWEGDGNNCVCKPPNGGELQAKNNTRLNGCVVAIPEEKDALGKHAVVGGTKSAGSTDNNRHEVNSEESTVAEAMLSLSLQDGSRDDRTKRRPEKAVLDRVDDPVVVEEDGVLSGRELQIEKIWSSGSDQLEAAAAEDGDGEDHVSYVSYQSELQMPDIIRLITKDLSEPYSIYTYRYFIHNWPKLCFLAMSGGRCVGAIVCKLDMHKKMVRRGYIAMLAVDENYRRKSIGSTLVKKAIRAMTDDDCDEVVLETEITNKPALRLYENLGFVRDKRLFRYYLNGVDALRLKLWLR